MPQQPTDASGRVATASPQPRDQRCGRRATPLSTRDGWIATAVFTCALGGLLTLRPFSRPLVLDPATWDYMSVRVAQGMVPYRDIFLHKTPGTAYIGAFGARIAAALGQEPVFGAHAVILVLGAGGAALLYLLCRGSLPVLPSLAAAAFLFGFDQWPLASVEGVRPKIATTTLGLACLFAADLRRFGWSGTFAGACMLCWQPGVVFLVGALWRLRREPERWLKLLKLASGAAVLPSLLILGLWRASALEAFFADTIVFNAHYIALMAKTPWETTLKILHELWHLNTFELIALPAALAGLALPGATAPVPLLIAGLVYLATSFVSFQAWPDTILFGAPLAATLAAGLSRLVAGKGAARSMGAVAVLALALAAAAAPSAARLEPPITFEEQRAAMRALAAGVAANDTVVAVSLPEFLIHTGRTSRWPWPYLWFGVDRFAAHRTPGGFAAILADLERDPPALILVARRWAGPLRKSFSTWAAERYDRSVVRIYPHTFRPIVVYRLRTR